MLRQLQSRAEDLAEWLLIFELEMRRSRTLAQRLEAYRGFANVVKRIDVLRREAEEALHSSAKDRMLDRLDRKVAAVMRTPAYRIAEWFETDAREIRWLVGRATVDPLLPLRSC